MTDRVKHLSATAASARYAIDQLEKEAKDFCAPTLTRVEASNYIDHVLAARLGSTARGVTDEIVGMLYGNQAAETQERKLRAVAEAALRYLMVSSLVDHDLAEKENRPELIARLKDAGYFPAPAST